MDRWQWISDRVPAEEDRQNLALLARVIEVDFGGRVEREKDLTAFMAARYRWGNKTTRRRAMRLATVGVVRWARSERDHWTKTYELVPEAELEFPFRASTEAVAGV
jgi:hypothetical protein